MLTRVKFDNAWVSVVFIFVVWQRHLAYTSFLNFAFRASHFALRIFLHRRSLITHKNPTDITLIITTRRARGVLYSFFAIFIF